MRPHDTGDHTKTTVATRRGTQRGHGPTTDRITGKLRHREGWCRPYRHR
jgi:hypothetical protein